MRYFKRILPLLLLFLLALVPASAVPAVRSQYAPRPAADGRTAILHGNFSRNGAEKSLIVIPADNKGNSKTTDIGTNAHSAVGGWDSIEMDCFNRVRGYYKTTLRLRGGVLYQFKIEQKNSGGVKDVWYGLDGYMSRLATDVCNGGSDANINLFLKHDDDVTFFFADGDRGDFVEWQPAPPHTTEIQPGTKFHLISVSTKLRSNLQGLGYEGNNNNIFDNNARGAWRWRDDFAPVWYSLTALPQSGEIVPGGTEISAVGELYLFRRTDVGELGMYGKWQLDNNIPQPALDKNSDYWRNAGAFYSRAENAPTLRLSDPNGADIGFALPYAADEKQPRHEEGANNIVFEGASRAESAGVYSYYLDEVDMDGTLLDDAQNFAAYPRHPAQSVFLPTLAPTDLRQAENGAVTLSGQVYGHNRTDLRGNTVYVLLSGEGQRTLQTAAPDAQGRWSLELAPAQGDYDVKIFAEVFTPQLIDPLARNFSGEVYEAENTQGVEDLNGESTYANQPYLADFIAAKNAQNRYAAFWGWIPVPDRRIYETDAEGRLTALGTGFAAAQAGAGTHTRSAVQELVFAVILPEPPAETTAQQSSAPPSTTQAQQTQSVPKTTEERTAAHKTAEKSTKASEAVRTQEAQTTVELPKTGGGLHPGFAVCIAAFCAAVLLCLDTWRKRFEQ